MSVNQIRYLKQLLRKAHTKTSFSHGMTSIKNNSRESEKKIVCLKVSHTRIPLTQTAADARKFLSIVCFSYFFSVNILHKKINKNYFTLPFARCRSLSQRHRQCHAHQMGERTSAKPIGDTRDDAISTRAAFSQLESCNFILASLRIIYTRFTELADGGEMKVRASNKTLREDYFKKVFGNIRNDN